MRSPKGTVIYDVSSVAFGKNAKAWHGPSDLCYINRRLCRCWRNTVDDNICQRVLSKPSAHTIVVRIALDTTIAPFFDNS